MVFTVSKLDLPLMLGVVSFQAVNKMVWISLSSFYGADTKNQRTKDSRNIIQYIYNNFEYVDLSNYLQETFSQYQLYYPQNVQLHKTTTTPEIELTKPNNTTFPLKSNSVNLLHTKFYALTHVSSTLQKNDKIGVMTLYYEDKILCSMDICLKNKIEQNSWVYYFKKILGEFREAF